MRSDFSSMIRYWTEQLAQQEAHAQHSRREAERRLNERCVQLAARIDERFVAVNPYACGPWSHSGWSEYSPPTQMLGIPQVLRVGEILLRLPKKDQEYQQVHVPALIPLGATGNLCLRGSGDALQALRRMLQAVAFRLIASTHPGTVRLHMIDPAGLGQTFSSLLRFPVQILSSGILHDVEPIEKKLNELTDRIAAQIRSQSGGDDMDEAKPSEVLLIADFPRGFSTKALQKLASVLKNGPAAQVHVLMLWDMAEEWPRKLSDEAFKSGVVIEGQSTGLTSSIAPLAHGKIFYDEPPDEALIATVCKAASALLGARATTTTVALQPPLKALWTQQAMESLWTPLGSQGSKVLDFCLNDQTAHVLVGGTPGSGKSVLLHQIVLGLCQRYSPEELQVFLLDFKQGVEFALYRDLPHARVVAIESERDFGVSVLEAITRKMAELGNLFKKKETANIIDYRNHSGQVCARTIVVIDEFQILFERSDQLARDAERLLKLIAQQGRGFGIHLVLASQTLPAITAVSSDIFKLITLRIALRMREEDAERFLSQGNKEPARLTNPGSGIYNDQLGQLANNRAFQTYYSSPTERAEIVRLLAQRDQEQRKDDASPRRRIIFEGNKPGETRSNADLLRLAESQPIRPIAAELYLGAPVAVQDTHILTLLRRQSRSQIVICGQEEESALAICLTLGASFALQFLETNDRLYCLDITNVNSPANGKLRCLGRIAKNYRYGQRREVGAYIEELHQELLRRAGLADAGSMESSTWLCILFGVANAREFQPTGSKPTPEMTKLAKILLEGPDLGLHIVLWTNTFSRLTGMLEPRLLSEFEYRIAIRGGDSERFLGNLGTTPPEFKEYYGVVHSQENVGFFEKFRCYGDVFDWISGLGKVAE